MTEAAPELRKRARRLNQVREKRRGADYVLCWLQQNIRAADNPAIDAAIAAGNRLNLPVVVYHALGQGYPHANARIHQFILEASRSLAPAVEARGLRCINYVERPAKLEKGLVYRLAARAAMIVTDDVPAFVARRQAERVAGKVEIPVVAIDASCLVPMNEFPFLTEANAFFRRAHKPLREQYLNAAVELEPVVKRFDNDFDFEPDDLSRTDLHELAAACDIDHTVLPVAKFDGSRAAALAQLRFAIEKVLPVYDRFRTNSAHELCGSKLSPYLHFGVLSVREVVRAVNASDAPSNARYKFLDELLSWREFFHHVARHAVDPTSYNEMIPEWARETLAEHQHERRETPNLDQMIHGETGDETWDAAQKQYLLEAWMPNNIRMYWGKRLVNWSKTPEEAWRTALYLNERFSLDGRDATTYGNIAWSFGRFNSPSSVAPVYGKVSRPGDAAMRRRDGVNEWIAAQAARPANRVSVPAEI